MSTHETARGPWRLTLVTNPDDCNLACAMCPCSAPRPAARPRRMDPALALALLDERRGSHLVEVIPSTMGEPLLWAGLPALLDRCATLGFAVNLTTNGTWPGLGVAGWAAKLLPVLSDVKVSWNAATRATAAVVMQGLDLARAEADLATWAGLRDAHAAAGHRRPTLSLQVTVQRANVDEVPAIVALAARLRVDRVKLNHVQPRPGLAVTTEGSLLRDARGLARWNRAVEAAHRAAEASARNGWPLRVENAVPLREDPDDRVTRGRCPFLGREAFVHFDGRLAPCPHPEAAALGALGSVADAPLGDLWESEAFRALRDGWPSHPLCRACAFRAPGGA
ncbi:MAG: radical SAM protein [Anaeromyxobacteraceae bacterium]